MTITNSIHDPFIYMHKCTATSNKLKQQINDVIITVTQAWRGRKPCVIWRHQNNKINNKLENRIK